MRQLKMAAALVLIGFTLAGCAAEMAKFQAGIAKIEQVYTVATTTTVPEAQAQIAVSSFQVLEAGSTEYFKFCKSNRSTAVCAPGTVASPGPLRLAIKYVRQGRAARDTIKAAAKTGQLISSTVYNLLIGAVNNLNTTPVPTFGVAAK